MHIRFDRENVLVLYRLLVEETGGDFGMRDEGLLDSALNAPYQTFGGTEAYPTILAKAARLCYGIIHNHPFLDGNKRMGVYLMLTFLESEKLNLTYSQDELVSLGLGVADGSMDYEKVLDWIKSHI